MFFIFFFLVYLEYSSVLILCISTILKVPYVFSPREFACFSFYCYVYQYLIYCCIFILNPNYVPVHITLFLWFRWKIDMPETTIPLSLDIDRLRHICVATTLEISQKLLTLSSFLTLHFYYIQQPL